MFILLGAVVTIISGYHSSFSKYDGVNMTEFASSSKEAFVKFYASVTIYQLDSNASSALKETSYHSDLSPVSPYHWNMSLNALSEERSNIPSGLPTTLRPSFGPSHFPSRSPYILNGFQHCYRGEKPQPLCTKTNAWIADYSLVSEISEIPTQWVSRGTCKNINECNWENMCINYRDGVGYLEAEEADIPDSMLQNSPPFKAIPMRRSDLNWWKHKTLIKGNTWVFECWRKSVAATNVMHFMMGMGKVFSMAYWRKGPIDNIVFHQCPNPYVIEYFQIITKVFWEYAIEHGSITRNTNVFVIPAYQEHGDELFCIESAFHWTRVPLSLANCSTNKKKYQYISTNYW